MSKQANQPIMIIAGEASGDRLGAQLACALQQDNPAIRLSGMGGDHMRQAGVDLLVNADQLAVVGAWEIISHFDAIRAAVKTLKKQLRKQPPALLILIDYPGFNLHLAKIAKKHAIKVLFYVSPQIWAWRYQRIHTIKKYVDHMAVLFSFEEKLYEKENMPVTFVGHPLLDTPAPTHTKNDLCQRYQLNPNHPIIGLFPGSRQQEIKRLLPVMMAAIPNIQQQIPNAQFILPIASSIDSANIRTYTNETVTLIENNTEHAFLLCDVAIATSGTVTLELAFHQIPLLIVYKTAPLTYWIGKHLLRIDKIGLCNIVAEKRVAKELIQHQVNADVVATEIGHLLQNQPYRQSILNDLKQIKYHLGEPGSANKVAQIALQLANQ